MKKIFTIIIVIILACVLSITIFNKKRTSGGNNPSNNNGIQNSEFDYKIIKETNKLYKENYMISPLSIGYALSMLKDGAEYNTKKEINNLLDDYKIDSAFQIKNKVSIANLLFIKNTYKDDISEDYIKLLQDKYNSDLMFDEFTTPTKANNWIKEKTFDMIPNAIDNIDPSFVLGLANAIAIDVEWKNPFDCNNNSEKDFTKEDKSTIKVSMMHGSDTASYIESKNATGIVKDYVLYNKETGEVAYEENDNTVALEYIAILPNKSIDEYMKKFDKEELNKLLESKKEADSKQTIIYNIPKYSYDFTYNSFKNALIELGVKDVFNPESANLNKMKKEDSKLQLYIGEAIHKSHIEFSEKGTKAAAVTAFMAYTSAAIEEKKVISITFDKPFIYIIKEKNKDNIWFFGTVYEPDTWDGNTNCTMEY